MHDMVFAQLPPVTWPADLCTLLVAALIAKQVVGAANQPEARVILRRIGTKVFLPGRGVATWVR